MIWFSPKSKLFISRLFVGIFTFSQFLGNAIAFSDPEFYVVKSGDTFSEIVWFKFGSPLYGKNGKLLKLISLNSHIKNPYKIKPGQKIIFEQPRNVAQYDISAVPANEQITEPESSEVLFLKETRDPYSEYSLSPYFYFSTITGEDSSNSSKAELISNLNFLVQASWAQNWSDKFSTSLQGSIRREEYYSSKDTTLDNKSLVQGGFGVATS